MEYYKTYFISSLFFIFFVLFPLFLKRNKRSVVTQKNDSIEDPNFSKSFPSYVLYSSFALIYFILLSPLILAFREVVETGGKFYTILILVGSLFFFFIFELFLVFRGDLEIQNKSAREEFTKDLKEDLKNV